MTVTVRLLGRPEIVAGDEPMYRFRSQKSWAALAYLLLADQPPSRRRLAQLLFDATEDPLRALRWSLAEVRRGLGPDASVEGDPVALVLPPGAVIDVDVVIRGSWPEALQLPGLGDGLLESLNVHGAAGFESWLLSEQQRVAAASEAVLHEAAQALMARHELSEAVRCAERIVEMSPLDENNQALLIRLQRMTGDEAAAERQFAAITRLLDEELGVPPGVAIESAMRETAWRPSAVTGSVSIEAILESGAAAVAAGATLSGITSLRSAVGLADLSSDSGLQVRSRLMLAETLIHSLRGMDEEGLAALYEADVIAASDGIAPLQAEISAELGYVDFLRGRYDRAELRLDDALALAGDAAWVTAKAFTYKGSAESDRAEYANALASLRTAITHARAAGDSRRETYATTMIARIHVLRGDTEQAADQLHGAIALGERDRWLAFLPWPQSFLGEVELARGDVDAAESILSQAFARACQLGDPCWEGVSARGLALVADARGDTDRAFELLAEARSRCNRLADPYVWLDAYIIDAQCELGRRHGHPDTAAWVDVMHRLSSRTAMREMTVRSLLHAAALGNAEAAAGARLLATAIDNSALAAAAASADGDL
jgi:DNA-binding SARP family transcriptional activator